MVVFSDVLDRCNMTVFSQVFDRGNMTVFGEVFDRCILTVSSGVSDRCLPECLDRIADRCEQGLVHLVQLQVMKRGGTTTAQELGWNPDLLSRLHVKWLQVVPAPDKLRGDGLHIHVGCPRNHHTVLLQYTTQPFCNTQLSCHTPHSPSVIHNCPSVIHHTALL